MEQKMQLLAQLIENKQYAQAKKELESYNVVDIAELLEELKEEDVIKVFRMLPKETAADVFAYLSGEMQQYIVESITDRELSYIIEDMFLDDAVDLIEEMPANVVKRVLKNAKEDTRRMINQFLQYPENSAGSIMTIEYVDLKRDMTVREAFDHIRRTGPDRETIYTCYVTDRSRMLEGIVTVRTLLLNPMDAVIGDIMDSNVIYVSTTDDQEEVANIFNKYDLLSLPVVDREKRLVGIVTVDDAVEVLEEEATEDFEKMAAMAPSEKPYLKTSVFTLAKNRIVWLLVLMVSAMLTGGILAQFEEAFVMLPVLITFVPMLTDTGGNSGSQSSTMIIRGMAVQEIKTSDILQVIWKDLRVSLLVGFVLSACNFLRVYLSYGQDMMLALTVSISLYATVVLAKLLGAVLPILAKKLKADPAIMAAPLITTIVDAGALILYFNVAKWLLHI